LGIEISSPMVNIGFVIDAPLSLSSGIDVNFNNVVLEFGT